MQIKKGITVNRTTVTGRSKQFGGRQRRSSVAGDKYSANTQTAIYGHMVTSHLLLRLESMLNETLTVFRKQ